MYYVNKTSIPPNCLFLLFTTTEKKKSANSLGSQTFTETSTPCQELSPLLGPGNKAWSQWVPSSPGPQRSLSQRKLLRKQARRGEAWRGCRGQAAQVPLGPLAEDLSFSRDRKPTPLSPSSNRPEESGGSACRKPVLSGNDIHTENYREQCLKRNSCTETSHNLSTKPPVTHIFTRVSFP